MSTSISSLGVGSGLDLSTLLTNLQTAESAPLTDIQTRATSYTTKLSAYSQIQSALNTLKTASDKLADPALFNTVKASVGDSTLFSAITSATTVAGTYTVNVGQLAQAQSLVSNGQADSKTAIGSGTVTIQLGTITGGTLDSTTGKYTGASFAADADLASVSITIGSGNNTLEGIRDSINKANAGVTASIVNDGSGTPYRLVLTSKETGATSSMQISVTGDSALQNLLGYDPAGTQSLKQTSVAQDAKLSVNGIDVVSASNTVEEAIQGTTLSLTATGNTTLKMTTDTSVVSTAVTAFVNAYNALQNTATTLSAYDADNKTAAALTGDQTLRGLINRVRQAVTTPQAGGTNDMKVLSEIGVSLQKDGTLALDSTKLSAAMAKDMKGVAALFSSDSTSTSGYGKQVSALVTNLTSSDGVLTAATNGINATLDDLSNQYNAMQDRVNAAMDRYREQFTQLDVLVASLNNTKTYLTQQFDAMTSSSK
ncbi:flagellar filament capping protein FliD [Variovorax sp. Sphag1AA]|uniref:flagellar filament capping protein FliD n=1 Tax=Variovorax sp. Sphag1AA TaxID=2587027 RepID=UPI00160F28CA|nr:flagellar filament capping protein FliD [Variovorax sp. Sphag1AA]MBB3179120.1 flagellar hook-associated protein 2 [Variovorax sp. Sphag1AA]